MSKGMFCPVQYIMFFCEVHLLFFSFDFFLALSEQRDLVYVQYSLKFFVPTVSYVPIHPSEHIPPCRPLSTE